MNEPNHHNYIRISQAIEYIQEHFKEQPSLDEIAEKVHLSPHHFQRIFTEWAGTTPKKFLQYTSIEYAKKLLQEGQASLFETAYQAGLSSTSRLHDLFVNIEGMTPAEYKNGGKNLDIQYRFEESLFGNLLIATTHKGICQLVFCQDETDALIALQTKFPNARFTNKSDEFQQNALRIFQKDWTNLATIKLHLKGTDFQLKVWETLLKIPMGQLSTYGEIANQLANPKASRAVGTAIGSNPIAFLIPCHRVIQATGNLGGYMWGTTRKTALIGWEAAQLDASTTV